MSGQISGQVPNQAATQLPSLPQPNGNYVPSQMQNIGGLRGACNMDQELPFMRRRMREKIYQYLQGQHTNHEMLPRLPDVAKRLEELLLKDASSKEEYINMESLEQRLQTLVRRLTQHQQLPHLMSSTSSIGTMIPTPGMPHNGNTSSTIPSSGDNSLTSSTFVPNTGNTGNLLATSNGSSGFRGVSFNSSDGAVANGSQSPANISVSSGGNNMMSVMSVPRMATQMIPTPGLNSPQSISVNSEYSNGGGFSSVESMVSQQHQHQHQQQQQLQQPKQYSGSQNSRILQGIGSQMGFGMRSNLQQKSSSYGFPNGTMNGRLQLIGNNIQLMNGSAAPESYLNASTYANSPKPLQQQSDQQRHQQIMQTLPPQMILTGDMYGMNANDVSGSGNLYGPATSVGSTMNNQNVNHMNLQSKPKTNSGMLTNQPNLQTIQQLAHIKTQIVDQSAKMSYQSPHSTREQLMQTQQQMQKFQQQQIQQPQYAQFVEHQHQQKQQTQQHQQLLLKNDILREPQLSFSAGGQIISEDGMEAHHEAMQAQISEHYHLSEFQNQYQQKNAAPEDYSKGAQMPCHPSGAEDFHSPLSQTSHQMQQQQQMVHSHQQMVESQNDFSCVSTGSLQEALLQGQWHPQPLENFQHEQSHQPSAEQHIQEEFHQRITGRDEAQRPRFSSEGSLTTHTDVSKGAPQQASTEVIYRAVTVRHTQDFKKQQRWLHLLRHARCCPAPEGKCISACISVKKLWRHMESCSSRHCQFPRCHQSTILLEHHRNCRSAECPVCIPCHQFWARLESQFIPLLDTGGAAESVNGTWRNVDDSKMTTKNGTSTTKIPEDLQPFTKRTKMDNQSLSIIPKSESCPVPVAFGSQSHTLQLAQPLFQSCQEMEVCVPVRSEAMEVKIEQFSQCFRQVPSPAFAVNKDVLDGVHGAQPDVEPKIQNELYGHAKQDNMLVKEADQLKVEVKQDIAQPADQLAGSKSGKPKIKAVSMTELFTPEQVREHIKGLRQWVGQSRAKAEKNQAMENSMSENSCQLCAVEKLTFEPPPIYCTQCGARIKRNAMYYTMGTGDTRHYFCIPCYNEVRGDTIEADGSAIPKARLEKKRNDEETEEWWVQCDKCEAWQHQICALFNGRRNDGGQAEYTCPNCYIEEVERGERKPLPQSAVLGAKDLPRTILSDHIEQRLARQLKQERHERARVQGKSVDEVPGAEALVIRVVSSVDKKLEVKQRFLEIFQDENYPVEFPYKSKVVLLFQKIEGVEVCLFGMYVQEFGSECQFPNQRRVYLSYLDSVKYFRPEIRTVTGEALRTFVYHEILIGYLEYCKKRGFTSCYIWACPPLKGEDYILYCHPEIQKTPKSDKLREWYLSMLRKAARENIVVDLTNLYDHFFIQVGESKAKVTAARLPYFDGDYWPGAAEDMINQLRQEEDGRKQQKKGKTKKTITKRALKAAGQADLSGNASKDALLMQKLGETICPMKEDFIMVHLQHACNHCCHLLVTGKRWACGQCKNFQLCNRCHEAEQKLEERERHPANSREKHSFTPVEINDVPADTKDKDEILESEFFDTRQAFLSLCQGNHYQYDTLRRAKHSSMMVLYHLHNPTAPAFVTTCNVCHHDIETGQGWRCEICPDFDVCNACYQKTGGADHPHKLTNHPSTAERDAQNTEAREKRVLQLRIMLDLLVHASQCRFPHCKYPKCRQVKGLFRHGMQCRIRASGGCLTCKKMWYLLQLHARACKESECHVPRCKDLKEHMRRLQQQSDSRRRAAVMEMMRQRAAEVAGNSG